MSSGAFHSFAQAVSYIPKLLGHTAKGTCVHDVGYAIDKDTRQTIAPQTCIVVNMSLKEVAMNHSHARCTCSGKQLEMVLQYAHVSLSNSSAL